MNIDNTTNLYIKKHEVLDHGHVALVDHMGNDLSIVRNARISYDGWREAGEDTKGDANLIGYLYKNGHTTPFECVVFTFDVKAPIFVIRQWQRHRTQAYNELSARYRELPEEFYVPEANLIGTQSKDNKQMRTNEQHELANEFRYQMARTNKDAFIAYKIMIANGCPRELARTVLPVSTYSHMFTTVNLHNLFKFLGERLHPHAQYEIRVYAEAILKIITAIVPVATQAFIDKHPHLLLTES